MIKLFEDSVDLLKSSYEKIYEIFTFNNFTNIHWCYIICRTIDDIIYGNQYELQYDCDGFNVYNTFLFVNGFNSCNELI